MSMPAKDQAPTGAEQGVVRPIKLAHVVLKTARFQEIVAWYKMVLGAHASFENEGIAFLTYDDEHHRIAVLNMPMLVDQPDNCCGMHHMAFTYKGLQELLATFERLEAAGINPVFCTNHGPTTSIYYADPDGNQLEFQVDNFETEEQGKEFFASADFAENPVGVDFDPHILAQRLRAGEPESELKRRPRIGVRSLDSVPLR